MKNFATKKDVIKHLESLCDAGLLYKHSTGYSETGIHVFNHNEYARPDYIPARFKDGWSVAMQTYYYGNYAPRQRVDLSIYNGMETYGRDVLYREPAVLEVAE